MSWAAVPLAIAGTGAKTVLEVQEARFGAKAASERAGIIEDSSLLAVEQIRKRAGEKIGAAVAGLGAANVEGTDTAQLVVDDMQLESELERFRDLRSGKIGVRDARLAEIAAKSRVKAAVVKGIFDAAAQGSSLLGGSPSQSPAKASVMAGSSPTRASLMAGLY